MTDCTNAEMRDLLPDLAAERLSAAAVSRAHAHLATCTNCADELALIRQVRAARPSRMKIDVGAIVAKLPRPTTQVISLDARRLDAKRTERERSLTTRARGAWKLAAALGVIVAGGWSIMMVRSGGIPTMQMQADSVPLTDVASAVVTPDRGTDSGVVSTPEDSASFDQSAILTFDTLHDLSEEEVTHLLDRLEKWDGATSTETSTMRPILVTTLPEVSK